MEDRCSFRCFEVISRDKFKDPTGTWGTDTMTFRDEGEISYALGKQGGTRWGHKAFHTPHLADMMPQMLAKKPYVYLSIVAYLFIYIYV